MGAGQEQRGVEEEEVYPLRPSLFPNVPPFIRFIPIHGNVIFKVQPAEEMKEMLWQVPCTVFWTIEDCIDFNGFTVSENRLRNFESSIHSGAVWDSLPCTEKMSDSIQFEKLSEAVKINQFPMMHNLGRKDSLYMNYAMMREQWGETQWNFMPQTFILPTERDLLRKAMKKAKKGFWIVKPPNLYQGMGIKVINDFKDVPVKKGHLCVQRYLKKPLLINNLKFDMRVYVLITSVDPLRIYIYEEGLARFATEPYTIDPGEIGNNFIHLTNYSINKDSEKFIQNDNPEEAEGSKWTLTSLWKHLKLMGIERGPIWAGVKDIVIKSILATYHSLKKGFEEQVNSHYNCYKLLGYDIFIDSKQKLHLLEINTLPSLAASPNTIDSHVKNPLVAEMFNIAGFHIPSSLACKHQAAILAKLDWSHPRLLPLGYDRRIYCKGKDDDDLAKETSYKEVPRKEYLETLLDVLTPMDVRLLVHSEDELSQTKLFSRVWPASQAHRYFRYFDSRSCNGSNKGEAHIPYSEKLMDAYEYYYSSHREEGVEYVSEYCQDKLHLKVPKQAQPRSGQPKPSQGIDRLIIAPAVSPIPELEEGVEPRKKKERRPVVIHRKFLCSE